jgi:hypothetical protein
LAWSFFSYPSGPATRAAPPTPMPGNRDNCCIKF